MKCDYCNKEIKQGEEIEDAEHYFCSVGCQNKMRQWAVTGNRPKVI